MSGELTFQDLEFKAEVTSTLAQLETMALDAVGVTDIDTATAPDWHLSLSGQLISEDKLQNLPRYIRSGAQRHVHLSVAIIHLYFLRKS